MRLASDVPPELVGGSRSVASVEDCWSGARSASLPSPVPTLAPVSDGPRLGDPMAEEVVRIRVRAMKVMMVPQRAAAVGGTGSWLIV